MKTTLALPVTLVLTLTMAACGDTGGGDPDAAMSVDGGGGPDAAAPDGAPGPDAPPGQIIVNPTSGLITTEGGGTATFTVVLGEAPLSNVSVALSSSATDEGTVSPSVLFFTISSWNSPQTVTISGEDDQLVDGNQPYTIVVAPSESVDGRFHGINPPDVAVENTDDDSPNVVVSPSSATLDEGMSATFTFTLTSQPSAAVTIPVSAPADLTLGAASVTLDGLSWSTGVTLQVTAVNDTLDEDTSETHTVTTGAITTTDPAYQGVTTPDLTVTIRDDDQVPITGAPGPDVTFTEGDTDGVVVDPTFTIVDPDSATLVGASVTITNLAAGDVLRCTSIPPVTCPAQSATGSLALSGAGTLDEYRDVLRTVVFINAGEDPVAGGRNIAVTASDSQATGPAATAVVNLVAVNDLPVLAPSTASPTYTENAAATALFPTLTIGDVDDTVIGVAVVRVTPVVAGDRLTCATLGPVSCSTSSTGTLTLTGTGTLAEYQSALRQVGFDSTSDDPTAVERDVELDVFDAPTTSSRATRAVTVTPVNDPTVVGPATATVTFVEDSAALAVAPTLTLSDVDSPLLDHATVVVSANFAAAEDVLDCTSTANISCSANGATLTLSGTAPLAEYQTLLRTVTYRNTSHNPNTSARTLTINVFDLPTASVSVARTVQVTAVNDPPTLEPITFTAAYAEGDPAVSLLSGITVTDPDSTLLVTASVSNLGAQAGDVLHCTSAGAVFCPASTTSTTLTITGPGSAAEFQSVLRSLGFSSTSNTPSTAARTLLITVTDQASGQTTVLSTVNVSAVDDPPEINSPVGLTVSTSSTSAFTGLTLSDLDDGPFQQLGLSIATPATGSVLRCPVTVVAGRTCTGDNTSAIVITFSPDVATAAANLALSEVRFTTSGGTPPDQQQIAVEVRSSATVIVNETFTVAVSGG